MLKTILIFLTLSTITTTVLAADVFKCNVDGKIIYQQSPCTTGSGQRMDIQINDTGVKGRLLNLYQFLWIFFMQLCCTDQAGFGA